MVTLSAFRRTIRSGGNAREVQLEPFQARWLDEQDHSGQNTGDSETHAIFVELKEPAPQPTHDARLGPSES
ncbi:Hypotetical protein [Gulosibacter molinativorax]|nr:Hypotetical protein [Gulosibacter molinativorax]